MANIRSRHKNYTILPAGTNLFAVQKVPLRLRTLGHTLLFLCFTLILLLPLLIAIWFGVTQGGSSSWQHIWDNRLVPYTATTLWVLSLTGVMILLIAVPAAWIIARTEFPGRSIFEWLLVLPLAMPGYVMAYAWGDLASVAGPLQSALRAQLDVSARDYWFPNVYSSGGLAFIFATTLYPYVYITARAAFLGQSQHLFEAARSLNAGRWSVFFRIGLPTAGPAILAGLTLALMEAAADYGAADFLGVPTLGVGIIRAWSSFGEPASAARLALILMALAASLLLISRYFIGNRTAASNARSKTSQTRWHLSTMHAGLVILTLSALLALAFWVPVSRLAWLFLEQGPGTRPLRPLIESTLLLGGLGTGLALLAALIAALARRHKMGVRLALLAGYATPGAVLGLGALLLLSTTGLPLAGGLAIGLLVLVYLSRFTYAGLEPLLNRQAQISPHLDEAARSLGSSGWHKFWRLDIPTLRPGLLAASLILFVEILKELPATLMLRPFGWDTLAVRAHAYATDERLAEATLPSLLIVAAGLIPVILISTRLSESVPKEDI